MIVGIIGDVGSGKTLLMTHLAHNLWKQGVRVYANYKLEFNHVLIKRIEDLTTIPMGGRVIICLDEAWLTGDSRSSMSKNNIAWSQFILQARKKRADVLYTVQHQGQIDKRIRINSSYFIKPEIIFSITEGVDPKTHESIKVPYMIKAHFLNKFMELTYSKFYSVYPCHKLYNTNEVVCETRTIRYDLLLKKYGDYEGSKPSLKALLFYDEGLSKTEANGFADYLFARRGREYASEVKGLRRETGNPKDLLEL